MVNLVEPPEGREHRLTRLWNSGFGRLALELNRAEHDLLEHPDDPAFEIRVANLRAALTSYRMSMG